VRNNESLGPGGPTRPRRSGLAAYLRAHEHPAGIIVCEQRKFLYMKAGKTAGTSILRAGLERRVPGIVHLKDQPAEFRDWLNRITDEELEEYFIFSVVRNPWDRLVSIASHFEIPLKVLVNDIDRYRKDEGVRVHALPLHLYTHLDGTPFVDVICRFERLQDDMNLCFDRMNIARKTLAFVNQSRHEHYTSYYTASEIKAVESIYGKDIDYFGYTFAPARVHKVPLLSRITGRLTRLLGRSA